MDWFSFSYLIDDQITSYLIVCSILSAHLILQQSRPVPRAVHATTLDVIQPSPQLHYDIMHGTQPYRQPCTAHMYSSIYRVQSSTRRLPIRALFGFTLKQVESYPFPFPSELHVWWLVLGSPWVTSVDTYQHVEEHHWLCFVSWMRIGCCHLHVGG